MKVKPGAVKGRVALELGARDERILAESFQTKARPFPIRTILVPIDFSEYSYKSLDYAAAFANESGAETILLHVVPATYVNTELVAYDYSAISREAAKTSEHQLERLREKRIPGDQKSRVVTRVGRPVDEIISVAQELKADLIVMSTHGYTGLKHAFLGSTTENVVRYAPCPVLTLREHEQDFVLPKRNVRT